MVLNDTTTPQSDDPLDGVTARYADGNTIPELLANGRFYDPRVTLWDPDTVFARQDHERRQRQLEQHPSEAAYLLTKKDPIAQFIKQHGYYRLSGGPESVNPATGKLEPYKGSSSPTTQHSQEPSSTEQPQNPEMHSRWTRFVTP